MSQVKEPSSQADNHNKDFYITRFMATSLLLAIASVIASGLLFLGLPERLTIGPNWLPLVISTILLLPLLIALAIRRPLPYRVTRIFTFITLGVVTVALIVGVVLLIITLPKRQEAEASSLLRTAGSLYIANVLVFSLWYWEIDGGGPRKRLHSGHKAADFMFPQQVDGNTMGWAPHFLDYLFVAFTGATALSPTDTYPLTRPAKALMIVEALNAMIIITIIIGRAVNIL